MDRVNRSAVAEFGRLRGSFHGYGVFELPYLDEFFGEADLRRFTRSRWSRSLYILCYVCVVDEVQHWIYDHPEASCDARDEEFVRLHDVYLPGIDWSDEAEDYRALRWYAQLHIFRYPFTTSTTRLRKLGRCSSV